MLCQFSCFIQHRNRQAINICVSIYLKQSRLNRTEGFTFILCPREAMPLLVTEIGFGKINESRVLRLFQYGFSRNNAQLGKYSYVWPTGSSQVRSEPNTVN